MKNIDISKVFSLFLFEYARVLKLLYKLNYFQVTSEKRNFNESFGHRRLCRNSVVKIDFVNIKVYTKNM